MNFRCFAAAVVFALALGGCATAPNATLRLPARPFKVSLLQILPRDREKIRAVVAPDLPKESTGAEEATNRAIDAAQSQALTEMNAALSAIPGITVVGTSIAVPPELDGFSIADRERPLSPDAVAALRTSDADMVLRFGISDYGTTPRAWRRGVITFEVVSTLGIAAIAYVNPATRPLAGAYLVQETFEETAEAYSGFWALDEVYRPVRVEAEMIDLHTGRQVWADSKTGLSDRRLARVFQTVAADERDAQLTAALHEAITKLARQLQESIRTN